MEYMSTREAMQKWGISERRIRQLLMDGRIAGAEKIGDNWMIPRGAEKPVDGRKLRGAEMEFTLELPDEYLEKVDRLAERLREIRPLSPIALKSLKAATDLEWTYQTNAIEGNTLTLRETQVVLEGVTVGGKTIREHLEAINHKRAIDYLADLVKKDEGISEWQIRAIHQLFLREIDDENAGKYRQENVLILGARHHPPEAVLVPELMQRLVRDCNERWAMLHPIVEATLLHGELVGAHPFVDGNGRTSRLMMNLVLMKRGFLPVIIRKEERLRYFEALDYAHVERNYTEFVKLVLENEVEMLEMYLRFLKAD